MIKLKRAYDPPAANDGARFLVERLGPRLRGDWAADIAAYDAIQQHILGMADVLSSGIMSQFAGRFN